MTTEEQAYIKTARFLAYLGLAPVTLGLIGLFLWDAPSVQALIVRNIITYSGLILVFISAIHWGLALHQQCSQNPRLFIIAIVPTLIAWIALSLPEQFALALLFISFIVWFRYESSIHTELNYPAWFTLLRKQLSYTLAALLLLTWLLNFDYLY